MTTKLLCQDIPLTLSSLLMWYYQNTVLRFANTTFWWLLLASAQMLWKKIVYERYFAEPLEQFFVDL